jgi:hypothetical protein
MGLQNPRVAADQGGQRNGLRRREREVVEDASVRRDVVTIPPRGLVTLRQLLARARMLVLAKPQKFLGADFPGQTQPPRALTEPLAGHALALVVVIPDAQVFLEVTLRVREAVLRLRRDHAPDTTRTVRSFCVSHTTPHEFSKFAAKHRLAR